jgi:hypothetical protein
MAVPKLLPTMALPLKLKFRNKLVGLPSQTIAGVEVEVAVIPVFGASEKDVPEYEVEIPNEFVAVIDQLTVALTVVGAFIVPVQVLPVELIIVIAF